MAKQPKTPGKNGTLTRTEFLFQLADRHLTGPAPYSVTQEEAVMPTFELLLREGHIDKATELLRLFGEPFHQAMQRGRLAAATGSKADVDAAVEALDAWEAGLEEPPTEYRARDGARAAAEVAKAATLADHPDAAALWERTRALAAVSVQDDTPWPRIAMTSLEAGLVDQAIAAIEQDPYDSSRRMDAASMIAAHLVRTVQADRAGALQASLQEAMDHNHLWEARLAAALGVGTEEARRRLAEEDVFASWVLRDLTDREDPGLDDLVSWLCVNTTHSSLELVDRCLERGLVAEAEAVVALRDPWPEGQVRLAFHKGDHEEVLRICGKKLYVDDISDIFVAFSRLSEDFARTVALPKLTELAEGRWSLSCWVPEHGPVMALAARGVVEHILGDAASTATLKAAFDAAAKLKKDAKESGLEAVSRAYRQAGDPLLAFKALKKLPAGRQKYDQPWVPVVQAYASAGDLAGALLACEAAKEEGSRLQLMQQVLWIQPIVEALAARGVPADAAHTRGTQSPWMEAVLTDSPIPLHAHVSGFLGY